MPGGRLSSKQNDGPCSPEARTAVTRAEHKQPRGARAHCPGWPWVGCSSAERVARGWCACGWRTPRHTGQQGWEVSVGQWWGKVAVVERATMLRMPSIRSVQRSHTWDRCDGSFIARCVKLPAAARGAGDMLPPWHHIFRGTSPLLRLLVSPYCTNSHSKIVVVSREHTVVKLTPQSVGLPAPAPSCAPPGNRAHSGA